MCIKDSYSVAKIYENSNHWAGSHSWMGPRGPYTSKSEHGCTALLQSNISTVLALSFILFRFLALYRPGLRDWGTVNRTQTGISKHSI